MNRISPALAVLACVSVAVVSTAAPARADVVGVVRGTLTRSDHHPIPHATLTLTGDHGSFTAVTDDDGRFAFPRVPFGHYTLRTTTPDGPATAMVDVDSDTVVDVPLLASRVIGHAAATSTGVKGSPVSVNTYDASQISVLPVQTNINRIVETVPGIVRFSYDEPVAHGFHGLTYELDGAPLPQSTSSNFAQLIDPREISAMEVFTGAFPAEFGGTRMGAVVNVQSLTGTPGPGYLTLSGGELGTDAAELRRSFTAGKAQVSFALDNQRTDRGLDTPTENALHDASSTANQFLRIAFPLSSRDLLAADFANQYATFQIPINTTPSDTSPLVAIPTQDDVQHEYDRFAAFSYTHTAKDGNGYFRIVPWVRYNRVAYDGDLNADTQGYVVNDDGSTTPQNGLVQDRVASYTGLRSSVSRTSDHHSVTAGIDLSQESFRSDVLIDIPGSPTFTDDAAQRGTNTGAYVEDVWSISQRLTLKPGLRYDHSTGYVAGSQLSPRFGVNYGLWDKNTLLHAYIGRLYAAPGLEDTRRAAVVTQTSPTDSPVYDLQPERDTYLELGLAHTFAPGVRGYLNAFDRTAVNVLDTTQLANTPLFAVFNNAIGVARGIEGRFTASTAATDVAASLTYSHAVAGGVSGGTFLFPPGSADDLTLQPEDHDQTWDGNVYVTRKFGRELENFATVGTEYGTGYPVEFQNGEGRLPAHFIVNATIGRSASRGRVGYQLSVDNLFDHRYLIKVNNGFNTTQWNAPRRVVLQVTAPW
jgi:outer membrane receptor protein involved in Fe transport